MQIGRIQGATRVLGQRQGYLGLPLRDGVINDKVTGPGTPVMETAWLLSNDEIDQLRSGAPLILRVVGTNHPPVMLYVSEQPSPSIEAGIRGALERALFMLRSVRDDQSASFIPTGDLDSAIEDARAALESNEKG